MSERGVFRKIGDYARKKSPWIVHMDCAGCNGCDIETFCVLSPRYDLERFGGLEKGNPRQSDVFLIAGAISTKIRPRLVRIYEQMPEPKVVIAIGSCAITKGVFHDAYNICGPLDKVIPVDVYVPGCPPKPDAILDGILKALELWKRK